MVSRSSAVPLYRQVAELLRSRLRDGVWRPGERVPAEAALAAEFAVNRLTVRQAISELTRSGELIARQGLGTYVTRPSEPFTIPVRPTRVDVVRDQVMSSLDAAGQSHVEELLGSAAAGKALARTELGAPRRAQRYVDTRLLVDGAPWMTSRYWFHPSRFPHATAPWQPGEVFYTVFQQRHGTRLRYAWRSFGAGAANIEQADALDVPVGTPILVREGLNVDVDGEPAMYVARYCRSDRVRFVLEYSR